MTEAKKSTKKPVRKSVAKKPRAKAPVRKKLPRKSAASLKTKVATVTTSSTLLKDIKKLKDKLNKTLAKEVAAFSKAIIAAKKKVTAATNKVKTLQERVQKARDSYREKPTAAAKNRYAKARVARQEASEKLADLRAEERKLKESLSAAQSMSRRQVKLEKGYLKLVAEVDKPKKRKTRKAAKVPGRKRGRPRKTAAAKEKTGTKNAAKTKNDES